MQVSKERVDIFLTDMTSEKRQAMINRKKVESENRKSYYRGMEVALEYTIDMVKQYILQN